MVKQYDPYQNMLEVLEGAAGRLGISQRDYEPFKYPERELKVSVPVQMDGGSVNVLLSFVGWSNIEHIYKSKYSLPF